MGSFKSLGVVFASNTSLDDQVDKVINKLARIFGIVSPLRYSPQICGIATVQFFYCNLNYSQVVWRTAKHSPLYRVFTFMKFSSRL